MQKRDSEKWPGPDDNLVIDAMLDDRGSHHWSECHKFVKNLVMRLASNFSKDVKEEIIQNSMFWIVRYLSSFKRECSFTSWIIKIVKSRIADAWRVQQTTEQHQTSPSNDSDEDKESESDIISTQRTTEQECILREELHEAAKELLVYLSDHAHTERNIRILEMHIAGFSQEDIAKKFHMPTPNVGYVIRSTQHFLRSRRKQK